MEKVKSVSDYIKVLSDKGYFFETRYPSTNLVVGTYFRGQINSEWGLSSSLYRSGEFFKREGLLIKHAENLRPDLMKPSEFSTLVQFQHYGMPTRLLDITSNPLVALYFACNDAYIKKDEDLVDGAVHIFPEQWGIWDNDPILNIFMEFIFHTDTGTPQDSKVDIRRFLYNYWEKHDKEKLQIYKTVLDIPESVIQEEMKVFANYHGLIILPKITNDRIRAQNGAFILSGMYYEDSLQGEEFDGYYYFGPEKEVTGPSNLHKTMREENEYAPNSFDKLVIEGKSKRKILSELDIMGVNELTLFPEIDHQLNYVIRKQIQDDCKLSYTNKRRSSASITF